MTAASAASLSRLASPEIAVPSATGVPARLVLAGPGARSIAFMLDWMLRTAISTVYMLAASYVINGNFRMDPSPDTATTWWLAGFLPGVLIYGLYHVILEPAMRGRTPGKRMAGIRVLTPEGVVAGTSALLIRNVFRIVDSLPVFYVVGLLFVLFGKRHLRLGDLAAGTVLAVDRAPFLEKLARERRAPDRHSAWHEIRQRAAALRRRNGSTVSDALGVVADYRRAAHQLNDARATHRPDAERSVEYLEAAYADLHNVIHRPARRAWQVLLALFRDRIPAALHTMRGHVFGVSLLFIISGIVGYVMVYSYPDLIKLFASPQMIETVKRGDLWTEGMLNVTPSSVVSWEVLTNNIVVSFFAFCSGVVFALGTLYIIGVNGLLLGAMFAFTGQYGVDGKLFDFVFAHGCVELSCICLAGAAGSFIGESLVRPKMRSRAEAFRAACAESMRVMVAVVVLLLICGFIEGYVSPVPEVPRWARITIGLGYWLFMISMLRGYVFGRSRGGAPINS
jgi:uncharacterized membrane protein SpoIIM required for sporulation